MKRITALAVAAAAALTSACVIIDADEVRYSDDLPPGRPASCDAAAYQALVGKADFQIDRARLPQTYRIVCHDCQVTMDYNANRLNIQLDPQNRVSAVTCG